MNAPQFWSPSPASSSFIMPLRRRLLLLALLLCAVIGLIVNRHAIARNSVVHRAITETTITTIAGGGLGSNVPARHAPMEQPTGVALDPQGRGFYVIDEVNSTSLLRFVNTSANAVTLGGVTIQSHQINLIAGGGTQISDDVPARDADLAEVKGLVVDPSGNAVYLAIPDFGAIRVVNVGAQDVTVLSKTIAPGTVSSVAAIDQASFRALALHAATRELHFIAGHAVYKLNNNAVAVIVAGGANPAMGNGDGGQANRARLIMPTGLAFDGNNNLLIADGGDPRSVSGTVRRVNAGGVISSLATGLDFPIGITVAPNGIAYVALGNAQQIISITPAGVKTTVVGHPDMLVCDFNANPNCGDGGPATRAYLSIPDSSANKTLTLAGDARGVFLPDFRFRRVRFINTTSGAVNIAGTNIAAQTINTVAGSGLPAPYDGTAATSAELFVPTGVAADALGNLFIADTGNNRLRFVNRTPVPVTLFATTPFATTVQPGQIVSLNRDVGAPQLDDRITTASFLAPQGLATTPNGLFIVDAQAGALIKIPPTSLSGRRSGVIRFLNTSNSDVTFFPNSDDARVVIAPGQIKDIGGVRPPNNPQVLGDGLSATRVAFYPTDVAVDRAGNIFVADQGNHRIRRIDPANGSVSTVYGDGTLQILNGATGIALDNNGRLHIADTRNNRILRQDAAGGAGFSIIADGARGIRRPRDLTVDAAGKIFITNANTHQVLDLFAPTSALGETSVVAGTSEPGFSGDEGPGPLARLNLPNPGTATNDIQLTAGIITLPNGDLVFTDTGNNRVRMLKRSSSTPPVVAVSAASFAGAELASESIAAAFGGQLATEVRVATETPLPTTLAGTTVGVRDSAGDERFAPLFFVAPTQLNFLVPQGSVNGPATITVTSGNGAISTGTINLATVAPGLFTADATGDGIAAAVALRIKPDGTQTFEPVARFDPAQSRLVLVPIDLEPANDQVFLILYGTGLRFRSSLANATATIGGANSEVLFIGPAEGFVGLDQCNLRLPRSLAGRGVVDILLVVDGKAANTTTVQTK